MTFDRRHPGLYAIEVRNEWHNQAGRAQKAGHGDLVNKYAPVSMDLAHLRWCTKQLSAALDASSSPTLEKLKGNTPTDGMGSQTHTNETTD